MPTGKWLTEKQKSDMYSMYLSGEKVPDIAGTYGVKDQTVRRAIRAQRRKGEEMASKSKVVAGDKRNGRLMSTADPHRFEGMCVVAGKSKSKTFVADTARDAEDQWRKWREDLMDEQAFMDMVERKREPLEESKEEVDVTPAPVPEITVRPWKEVAEERGARIAELEAELAEAKGKLDVWESGEWVMGSVARNLAAERDALKARVEHAEAAMDEVGWEEMPSAFLLWAKAPEPKFYGLYRSMDAALEDLDRLNDVAEFLGQEHAFEVEEARWR